jgi:hypothetical protein
LAFCEHFAVAIAFILDFKRYAVLAEALFSLLDGSIIISNQSVQFLNAFLSGHIIFDAEAIILFL